MKKNITQVNIEQCQDDESHYDVVVTNSKHQVIRPHVGLGLREALTEAQDWADFLGVKLARFTLHGKVIRPVSRGTYNEDMRLPTAAELITQYRTPAGDLNLNKLLYWEQERFRIERPNKQKLLEWILPWFIEGPTEREWLSQNCHSAWLIVAKGVRFHNERDATLYKLFFFGEKDARA